MADFIRYGVEDGVGIITIDRPEKRNAMSYAMLGQFIETIARAGADDTAHVLILTGSGGAFCAGTDLSDLATVPGAQRGLRGRAPHHAARRGRIEQERKGRDVGDHDEADKDEGDDHQPADRRSDQPRSGRR